jgi:predicted N-acetyltransferase YhbS
MLHREERPSDIAAITNVLDKTFEGTEESRIVLRLRKINKLTMRNSKTRVDYCEEFNGEER